MSAALASQVPRDPRFTATMTMSNRLRRAAANSASRLVAAYRRTGADVPFGDPLPSHGSEMEGWFWRVTDSASGRVVVALCGVNRHSAGDWATVAVALHPGGVVRAAALDGACADQTRFALRAGTAPGARIEASADRLHVDLDDVHLDLRFTEPYVWPKAFGGGGVFSAIPFLNQYWHPYRLGGTASGTIEIGGDRQSLDRTTVYAERNWGAGFPDRWWWGQAHDFDGADVSVAFSGGVLRLGPVLGGASSACGRARWGQPPARCGQTRSTCAASFLLGFGGFYRRPPALLRGAVSRGAR